MTPETMMEEERQDRTKIRIYTDQFMITGDIAMFADTRLTDYIIGAREFIAVTNAESRSLDGAEVHFKAEFLNVQKARIVMIVPEKLVKPA